MTSSKPSFKRNKQRIFLVHYDPGKKLFHVMVKLSDAPGSYSHVLDTLRSKLNLIGTTTYSLSDGSAMFSGFAEGLSPSQTPDEVRALILGSKAAMEAEVKEGREGLLIDTFHTGFAIDGDSYMLLRTAGLAHVFDRVSKILGSGGEALLYEEGMALGQWDVEAYVRKLGVERVRAQIGALNRILSAQGWGDVKGEDGPGEHEITMNVGECFECSGEGTARKVCSFMRGYFAGAAEAVFGNAYDSKETKCKRTGGDHCEFRLTRRK
jgi:predicted hydrocarbon binding protein